MKSMKFVLTFALLLLLISSVSATAIGTTWNQSNSSPSAFSGYFDENYNPISPPDFNATEPWASMGRVNISNNTFVAVKKFYYKTDNVTVGSSHWMNYSISMTPLAGYTVHEWFKVNTTEIPVQYIGAFEGSTYNVTTGTYVGDPASINIAAGTGDRLVSVAGQKPTSGLGKATLTLPAFRTVAQNNGANNELQSFNAISAIEMMYILEYRNWDSQTVIGTGVTQITDDLVTNMAIPTGLTAGSGANSTNCGNFTCSVPTVHYQTHQVTNQISYRGYEAMYGNGWKWVDFINIKADRNPWFANYSAASDTFSGSYRNSGLTLASSNGYVSNLAYGSGLDYGFLASGVSGSASTYLTDYYYQESGHRAALFGGGWSSGLYCGPAYWTLNAPASDAARNVGGRLAFTPPIYSNFTYANSTPTVIFTDTSYNISTRTGLQTSPTSWNWSFGDGQVSSLQNPSHTYASTGTYTVNLTASDGTNYDTKLQTVYVTATPVASFTPSGEVLKLANETVQFTDTSTSTPTSWNWYYTGISVGNNTKTQFSTTQNPLVSFSVGNFTIALNATNSAGTNQSTQITWINVSASTTTLPTPSFTTNVTSGVIPLSILFNDTSTGPGPFTYFWDFGDLTNTTTMNATHTYSSAGAYTVNHSVTNLNGTAYATPVNITATATLSGFNRVDLVMDAAYTLTVTFVDSVTSAPIPVVTVIDNLGNTQTTSTGVFTYSYSYGPVVLYVSSSGYAGKSVSYYMDSDKTETVQLVQSVTTSTQSTWWTPHAVQITIFDTYGNPLDGVAINATYNESSMPTNWLQELYGIKESPATDMTNMSLVMAGTTGTDGSMTFTMLGSLKYDIYLTSSTYGLSAYHVSAYPSDSMLNIYVPTGSSVPIVRGNSTYSQLNGTRVYATEPDIGNVSMCIDYKDTSGLTTSVTDTWLFKNNNTVMNTTTFVPGTILNTHCYTIRNVRGTQVWWGYNATRTGV